MSNTFGNIFRITSWGESHGPAIGCVVDGCPSGLELSVEDIQRELDRRSPGKSPVSTERREPDKVEILSGVFERKTIGTPISLYIKNQDADSGKYLEIKNLLRPGQAEYTYREKYGVIDWRGGGRASGRETAARVAGGAIAIKLLRTKGIEIIAYSKEIAGIRARDANIGKENLNKIRKTVESNSVRAIDLEAAEKMEQTILDAKKGKDSVGGIIEAMAFGIPPGLGEPVFDKLGADLSKALMSIPGVKGIEIGAGFGIAGMRGSDANDPFVLRGGRIETKTNNSGGILGGMSNGMPIVLRAAIKPTASIGTEQGTVDYQKKKETEIVVGGRHDPCIVPRAVPVVESMIALVLADHALLSGVIPRKLD